MASTVVAGTIEGVLTGGNTEDVHAELYGHGSFHLDGSTQYITIPLVSPLMRSDEIQNLWTKHENGTFSDRPILELCAKPGGGWYRFGVNNSGTDAIREESTDLINWSNQVVVMSGAPGSWDEEFSGVLAFQKDDGSWIMTYRGAEAGGGNIQSGIAYSADGATFTRKDNGGVNDGLFPQFGANYDPFCVLKVGSRWYMYVNGDPSHGHTNIYYSDDDFATFTQYGSEPIFMGFCPYVFKYGGYYYILINRDINESGSTLYDHGIAFYRSPVPTFDFDNREYLGYAVINDETFDARYLDVPSCPFTDVYRDTYAPEFGDTLHMLYTAGLLGGYARATTSLSGIASLPAIPEADTELYHKTKRSFSFNFQLDTLTADDVFFSVGSKVTDSSPVQYCCIKGTTLALFLDGGFRTTSLTLATGIPYQVVIVDDLGTTYVYINTNLVGTFAYENGDYDGNYLFIGNGEDNQPMDGYIWDVRIYEGLALTAEQVQNLYVKGRL